MKVRFESDYNLPLKKTLKLHSLTVVARTVFEEKGKYYPQVLLDECFYEIEKCCGTIELVFQKELILIK